VDPHAPIVGALPHSDSELSSNSESLCGAPYRPRDALIPIFLGQAPAFKAALIPNAILENPLNNAQVKGEIKDVKGQIKETTGKILDDKTLENTGKLENVAGKIEKAYGDAKEEVKKES